MCIEICVRVSVSVCLRVSLCESMHSIALHTCVYMLVCVCVFSRLVIASGFMYVCLALPCLFMFIMHNFICLFAHECK